MIRRPDGMPRRCDTLLQTEAEKAIGEAIRQVEQMGCHPELTTISVELMQLREKVADFIDTKLPSFMSATLLKEIDNIKAKMNAT